MDQNRKWKLIFEFLKDQGLSLFSLFLVLLLAAGAFALSYAGLKDLAAKNGVEPGLVWVWPLVLDGAIIVFSVCAFRAGICGESIAYPMFLVVISTLASIAFNILHAPIPEDATFWSRAAMIPRVMASIPPLALFLSFEVMIRQLKSQVEKKRIMEGHPLANSVHFPEVEHRALPEADHMALPNAGLVSAKAPRQEPAQRVVAEEPEAAAPKKSTGRPTKQETAAAKALVIEMCKKGALLEEMAEASGRSPRTVTRYLNEAGLSVPMGAK